MIYDWQNLRTGKIVEHDHPTEPPSPKGRWKRLYSFGLSRVEGAGEAPARSSVKKRV